MRIIVNISTSYRGCGDFYLVQTNASLTVPTKSAAAYTAAECWRNFNSLSSVENVFVSGPDVISCHDLYGHEVDKGYRGVVIVRYSDGSVRKVEQK